MFTTKIAIVVREDLAQWQKLNVTAFLASGIAAAVPACIGEAYVDAAGRRYGAMCGQPILVFAGALTDLQKAHGRAIEQELVVVPYVEAMFATGHDAANRAVFAEGDVAAQSWVGLAVHGERKAVDKALKGLKLHP
ncbi:DUF2000 family protein [Ferrovibrio terrae]|uniref:DUF2000 family protein n=1 Tax=Ferrovibrio terrae TaxID=2594003 RepID=A0A516GYJ7_9PROT|nr:DUF2000 family protein [Ferrovibrio terrae]QDO96599.1 DUF2000 family protein [Ferrovibrio terrae]